MSDPRVTASRDAAGASVFQFDSVCAARVSAALRTFSMSRCQHCRSRSAYVPTPAERRGLAKLTTAQLAQFQEATAAYFAADALPRYRDRRHPLGLLCHDFDRILARHRRAVAADEEPRGHGVPSAEQTTVYLQGLTTGTRTPPPAWVREIRERTNHSE